MLEAYEKLSNVQKVQFKEVCNKLLTHNFLARDKKDNKDSYYFLMSFKDIFDSYFSIIDYKIELNNKTGAVMLMSSNNSTLLKLKRDDSIILLILRFLYHEKLKETTLTENIVCQVSDIHEKYDFLGIKRKLNKTDLQSALRLFRRYNLIEAVGELTSSSCKIVIMPTILLAISTEDINNVLKQIKKISQGGEDSEETGSN